MPKEQQIQAGLADQSEEDQTVLRALGLGPDEAAALRRQGFVSSETRDGGKFVFKLRFRLGGRQRVKHVGTDRAQARRLQQTLERLQQDRRRTLALGRLNREAAKLLRDTKRRVEPLLNLAGYRFHGRAIRRPRRPRVAGV